MSTRVEISKRLVFINSVSSVASHVIRISVFVWLQQYLLRGSRISPEEYSLYPVLMSVMMFAPLMTTILTAGLARYVIEAYAKGDERGVTQIVSTMFPLVLGAGLLILAGGWLFAWYVDHILVITPAYLWDARIMMALLVLFLATWLVAAPFRVGLYVRQRFVLLNVIKVCTELLRIGLLFALLFGVSTRVLWVVVASVSAQLVGLGVTQAFSQRLLPSLRFRRSEIRWALAGKLTSFGGWNLVGEVAATIRDAADPIILNRLGTAVDVTCFHLGSIPHRQIGVVAAQALHPILPAMTAMHTTGKTDQLGNTYLRGSRYGLWGWLFFALPLIVYSRPLMMLYTGEKYIASATVMWLLLGCTSVAYANTVMLSHVAHARAQIRGLKLRSLFVHGTNLALTLYFVGRLHMGAVGSALATFLVTVIGQPLLYYPMGWRMANVRWTRWLRESIWPGVLPGMIALGVWIPLRLLVDSATWLSLGLCAAAGLACYVVVLLVFCLQGYEKVALRRMWAKVFGSTPSFMRRW